MTYEEFKEAVIGCGNDVYFTLNDLPCGIWPTAEDSVFSFEVWYDQELRAYDDFDAMMYDKFFDGNSIVDLFGEIEFDFR